MERDDRSPQNPNAATDGPASAALGPVTSEAAPYSELNALVRELGDLEGRAAGLESRLAELRGELGRFETKYRKAVAPRYKELDRIEAEIAEALAAMSPDDADLQAKAREARARADETAEAVDEDARGAIGACGMPSVGLKRLYRRVAFEMHPDRCGDAREAALRHELMVEANRAYRDGDHGALESLLAALDLAGAGSSLELRSLTHRIARARRRLGALERELAEVEASEIHGLWRAFASAAAEGRDLFQAKLDELDRRLSRMRARLDVLVAMS